MLIAKDSLYRRREGIFTQAVYQVVTVDDYTVGYTVHGNQEPVFPMPLQEFAETFIALTADEVLKETGGIF